MQHYRTKDGDMLDDICHRHYGDSSAIHAVLEANPRLGDQGAILPAGITITLPTIQKTAKENTKLWD